MKVSKTISTKIKENPSDVNEVRKRKQQHRIETLLDFSEIIIPEEFGPLSLEDLDFKVVTKEIPVIVITCYFSTKALANKFRSSQDFEILDWCPAGQILPHGEKVPL